MLEKDLTLPEPLQEPLRKGKEAAQVLCACLLYTSREVVGVKKRVLSAAGRAAIVRAAKKRWAKVRKRENRMAA